MSTRQDQIEWLKTTSPLDAGSSSYVEQLYDAYLKDPKSVSSEWRQYFEQLPGVTHAETHPEGGNAALLREQKQIRVRALIDAYRLLGHLHADIDPLHLREKPLVPELMLSFYQLSPLDFDTVFDAGSLPGARERPLKKILDDLKRIYCETVASEFMHIPDSPERIWVQEQVENTFDRKEFPTENKRRLLEYLIATEGLEKYLGSKYPGAKRFSIEGADTLIVALDTLIQHGDVLGVKEIIIGMAHRGRLNILVNLLGKLPSQLFDEFEGKHHDISLEAGDVKYHQGFSSNVKTLNGSVHLSVAYNPSHLEIVSPVVCGSVRARQERRGDAEQKQVLPIAIHGDAAFSGQGVIMETLNMSQTRGFKIGGTIHIIIDNQIGFTTSNPQDARSTLYCSDIGKMLEIPILHVNADDPESVYRVAKLALSYRTKFKKDIIIDLVGYRRQGHNEADEPAVTQPIMYHIIRKLPPVYKLYGDRLIEEKIFSREEIDSFEKKYRDSLDNRQSPIAHLLANNEPREFSSDWQPYLEKDWRIPTKTGVPLPELKTLADKQTTFPKELVLHPRVQKIMDDRRLMTEGKLPMDWGYAETLAYATLLNEGYGIRLSGQDSGRGTFFHRHVVIHNQQDGSEYIPLAHLSEKQAVFTIVDSLLSEEGVLGFEYGFSNTDPKNLVIWEAQFGDFANNAQGVIDQFISSGEQKWGKHSGLTLFLPHGYEGQGAEHSSARLERYLQLCAEHNMQVCVPSTPAQIFHLLRRQMLRPMRKPLIVLTPKSLLRHKLAVSSLTELSEETFMPVLPEIDPIRVENVKQVILCSGKVYYELLEKRRKDKIEDVAILRVEQLYPFPDLELKKFLQKYSFAKKIVWCQEEPKNQGAWYSSQHNFVDCLLPDQQLQYVGREASAAPAVGYIHLHQEQQNALVQNAFS